MCADQGQLQAVVVPRVASDDRRRVDVRDVGGNTFNDGSDIVERQFSDDGGLLEQERERLSDTCHSTSFLGSAIASDGMRVRTWQRDPKQLTSSGTDETDLEMSRHDDDDGDAEERRR